MLVISTSESQCLPFQTDLFAHKTKNAKQKTGGGIKYHKGRIDRMDDKEANFMVSSLS